MSGRKKEQRVPIRRSDDNREQAAPQQPSNVDQVESQAQSSGETDAGLD